MIDLIIVNYKSTDLLHECLDSVYSKVNGTPTNVFVFDNGSQDHIHLIPYNFPKTKLIQNDRNLGFSRAINRVLKRTSSPYVVVLNPDTVVNHGFFESVLSFMEKNSDVGILGPKIFDSDGCIQGSARSFPTFSSAFFGRKSLLTKIFPNSRLTRANILTKNNDGKTPMEVDWVSGACMMVRRKALDKVGLLDERFFLYWEDIDWCKRRWDNGWKVTYFPQASVEHTVGGSSEQRLLGSIFDFHRSAYRFYCKENLKYGSILKPLIFLGLSLRFAGILSLQVGRRYLVNYREKNKKYLSKRRTYSDLAN